MAFFCTKLQFLTSLGEQQLAVTTTNFISLATSSRITISPLQRAAAKHVDPAILLKARYGAAFAQNPPSNEFLSFADRRLQQGITHYPVPHRTSYDTVGTPISYDVTSFHPAYAPYYADKIFGINLPDIFYRMVHNNTDMAPKNWDMPPTITDINGNQIKINGRPLRDFEVLPDVIGRNSAGWFFELAKRLDPRIHWEDIRMRMPCEDGGKIPLKNAYQTMLGRMRREWSMRCFDDRSATGRKAAQKELSRFSQWHVANNTTKGLTPGSAGPDGRVAPWKHPRDEGKAKAPLRDRNITIVSALLQAHAAVTQALPTVNSTMASTLSISNTNTAPTNATSLPKKRKLEADDETNMPIEPPKAKKLKQLQPQLKIIQYRPPGYQPRRKTPSPPLAPSPPAAPKPEPIHYPPLPSPSASPAPHPYYIIMPDTPAQTPLAAIESLSTSFPAPDAVPVPLANSATGEIDPWLMLGPFPLVEAWPFNALLPLEGDTEESSFLSEGVPATPKDLEFWRDLGAGFVNPAFGI